MKKIILCTGGTGGHIFPMIALYEELKKNYQVKILTDQRALKYLDQNKIFGCASNLWVVGKKKMEKWNINLMLMLLLLKGQQNLL